MNNPAALAKRAGLYPCNRAQQGAVAGLHDANERAKVARMSSNAQPLSGRSPAPRIGDRWMFETRLADKPSGVRLRHQIESAGEQGYVALVRGESADAPVLRQGLDRSMNRLWREVEPGEAIRYTPAFELFRFPMEAGLAWRAVVEQRQDGVPGMRRVRIDARVAGAETVTTPAGAFDAWRIEAEHRAGDARIATVYWYCPVVHRSVRGEEHTETPRGRSTLIYELLEWRPA